MNKTKAYLLVLAIAILLFLSVVMISAKSDKTGKIEQKVLDSLEKEGKINVIVILKEPAKSSFKSEKQRILARAEIKQEVSDNLGKEKVKQQFSSINAFSARLTADDIAKLEREDNVAFVYYDIPVKAFLQDSVPLINATKTWSLQSNGINLTGKG